MDEKDHQEMKELHERIAARDRTIAERDNQIRALIGELIKKRTEVDYPVAQLMAESLTV